MRTFKLFVTFIITLTLAAAVFSGGKKAKNVGAKKCKMCHNKKSTGKQYTVWKSKMHAKAYETLKNEQSAKIAKKMGIKDATTDQKCLECHITDAKFKEEGVSCESCHGPGSLYKSPKIMSTAKYKKDWDKQHKLALEAGLVPADEKLCKTCHNKRSPTYKKFVYKVAVKEIAHPNPKRKK